ncbi:hypothetical protein ACM0T4_004930 [Escherichia coli]
MLLTDLLHGNTQQVHPVQLALQRFHQVWQRLVPLLVVEWLLAL